MQQCVAPVPGDQGHQYNIFIPSPTLSAFLRQGKLLPQRATRQETQRVPVTHGCHWFGAPLALGLGKIWQGGHGRLRGSAAGQQPRACCAALALVKVSGALLDPHCPPANEACTARVRVRSSLCAGASAVVCLRGMWPLVSQDWVVHCLASTHRSFVAHGNRAMQEPLQPCCPGRPGSPLVRQILGPRSPCGERAGGARGGTPMRRSSAACG